MGITGGRTLSVGPQQTPSEEVDPHENLIHRIRRKAMASRTGFRRPPPGRPVLLAGRGPASVPPRRLHTPANAQRTTEMARHESPVRAHRADRKTRRGLTGRVEVTPDSGADASASPSTVAGRPDRHDCCLLYTSPSPR